MGNILRQRRTRKTWCDSKEFAVWAVEERFVAWNHDDRACDTVSETHWEAIMENLTELEANEAVKEVGRDIT